MDIALATNEVTTAAPAPRTNQRAVGGGGNSNFAQNRPQNRIGSAGGNFRGARGRGGKHKSHSRGVHFNNFQEFSSPWS